MDDRDSVLIYITLCSIKDTYETESHSIFNHDEEIL